MNYFNITPIEAKAHIYGFCQKLGIEAIYKFSFIDKVTKEVAFRDLNEIKRFYLKLQNLQDNYVFHNTAGLTKQNIFRMNFTVKTFEICEPTTLSDFVIEVGVNDVPVMEYHDEGIDAVKLIFQNLFNRSTVETSYTCTYIIKNVKLSSCKDAFDNRINNLKMAIICVNGKLASSKTKTSVQANTITGIWW